MENDDFDGERNEKEIVLELLKFSTQPSATICIAKTIHLTEGV